MPKKFKQIGMKFLLVAVLAITISTLIICPNVCQVPTGIAPRNVILLIGDGMGCELIRATGMYANGEAGTLSFEALPHFSEVTTYSANSYVTDSAAAASAMATGVKVDNGVVSVAIPGFGYELKTILEYFRDEGKSTGLVTTVSVTHGTPAAFGAHERIRYSTDAIASDYLTQTRPNVIFGGGGFGMSTLAASQQGYTVVTNYDEMNVLDTDEQTNVSGQFGDGDMPFELDGLGDLPQLSQMTAMALDILDNDPDGFFLMVEGGRIDHGGHFQDISRMIHETIEFNNAVKEVIDWAAGRTDTLVIVTSDHETGGLSVTSNNGIGNYPTVSWSALNHTSANVPMYAWGVHSEMVSGTMDNTDIFYIVMSGKKRPWWGHLRSACARLGLLN